MIPALSMALWLLAAGDAPTAVENVRVEVGDGTVLESATVLFDTRGIIGVGEAIEIPAGATRVDGRGRVLTPGLIETVTQLGLLEVDLEPSSSDAESNIVITPGYRAVDAFNPLSVRIPVHRAQGVTSIVASPVGRLLYGTGAWVDLTGELADVPGRTDPLASIAMFGGVGARERGELGGTRAGLWLHLREVFADARAFAARRQAFESRGLRELSLAPLHLEALRPVLDRRIPLVVVANRASDIRAALSFAQEQKIRLIIAGGAEAWRLADRIAEQEVPVILRPSRQAPASFDQLAARDDAPALLAAAGVTLVLTTYGWAQHVGRLRQEAGIAVANGLDRNAAMRAITLTPAEIFGRADNVGAVRPRMRADLVLWSGDPLELDTTVERMWIDGEPQSTDTRQKQLAQRYYERMQQRAQP